MKLRNSVTGSNPAGGGIRKKFIKWVQPLLVPPTVHDTPNRKGEEKRMNEKREESERRKSETTQLNRICKKKINNENNETRKRGSNGG